MSTSPRPVLCLGDPMVDLVCEAHIGSLEQAAAFTPHLGGAVSNIAVTAARAGAPVELLGAVGADAWGSWVRGRLEAERVGVRWLAAREDVATSLAFVSVDRSGEATYTLAGGEPAGVGRLDEADLAAAVEGAAGLVLGSNSLVGAEERAASMRARELALEQGIPVVLDANLRLHRWRSRADAAASTNACVHDATLVRVSASEAEILTGEEDPERAASALLKAGARAVVVSLGADGAMLRGAVRISADAPETEVRSTSGAGDVLTGTLLARLALSGWYLPAAAAGLRDAVARASLACARWGALE